MPFPWVTTPPDPVRKAKPGVLDGSPTGHPNACRPALPDAISATLRYTEQVATARPDRGGGIARNGQKSALGASLLHTACNSRAICPSQGHIRVTHNPWVAGSSPARPTR